VKERSNLTEKQELGVPGPSPISAVYTLLHMETRGVVFPRRPQGLSGQLKFEDMCLLELEHLKTE